MHCNVMNYNEILSLIIIVVFPGGAHYPRAIFLVAIIWGYISVVNIILRGNSLSTSCPRAMGDNFRASNFWGGNYLGGNYPWGQLSGRQLSWGAIVRGQLSCSQKKYVLRYLASVTVDGI